MELLEYNTYLVNMDYEKEFWVEMPDEPFSTKKTLGKKVKCIYRGFRYLLVAVDKKTKRCMHVSKSSNDRNDLEGLYICEDGCDHFILDADSNAFEAAYITNNYTHDDLPPFECELPTGEKWQFDYDQNSGVITTVFKAHALYRTEEETFLPPLPLDPFVTKESFWAGIPALIDYYQQILKTEELPQEKINSVEEHIDWLSRLSDTYQGIDHWKIPFKDPLL